MNFNSHAHVERDDAEFKALPSDSDFNSHAHVERDAKTCADSTTADISTHTLTWSVTVMNTQAPLVYCISTHTLTWSVTSLSFGHPANRKFQLTRSRGA